MLENGSEDQPITADEDNGYDSGLEVEENESPSPSKKNSSSCAVSSSMSSEAKSVEADSVEADPGNEYQRAMFEEARNAYYKNQSSVRFLMDFIYGDGGGYYLLLSCWKCVTCFHKACLL